jgi:hypothetical protein
VRGRVLEIGDPAYTRAFGADRVTHSDVLHATAGNPKATIVGDLVTGDGLESDAYDCVILTQTLLLIYVVPAAIRTVHRTLAPGGVALVTVPGISQIARNDMRRFGDYWRFTDLSIRHLFDEVFPSEDVDVSQYGNILIAIGFLHGLVVEEMTREELDHFDEDYPVILGVRVRKPALAGAQGGDIPT